MRVKQFFATDFKDFSIYDTKRSIPSVIDGFKPSQRKVMFGMIKKGAFGPDKEQKVAQAAGAIASVSDYHHGEVSLMGTIIGLAQNYSGANNINYLHPEGQFGSRLTAEAAAPRYIFTYINDNFRKIFKKEDDIILDHLLSDGMSIEPKYYLPIIPNILVNGAKGMGTGYACNILSYNPADLKQNILTILKGKTPKKILPWFKGFNGKIYQEEGQTVCEGAYEMINTTTLKITELPVGTYLDKYKEHLNKLEDSGIIKDYDDNSTEEGFEFTIRIPRNTYYFDHEKIMNKFKLISRDTENFTLWDEYGYIKVFKDAQEVIDYFVVFRLAKYEERRLKQIVLYTQELEWFNEKHRFIKFYLDNHDMFAKKKKDQLFSMLEKEKFIQIDRLLSMKIYSLTKDEIDKLKDQIKDIKLKIQALKDTNNVEMYIKELEELKLDN